MIKKLSLLAAGVLLTASAQAATILGSISFTDGFDAAGLPATPSGSITSNLTSLDVQNAVNAYTAGSATGSFAGTTTASAFDILPPALPTTFFTTDTGFTFTITSFVKTDFTPLSCLEVLCGDEVDFFVSGTVAGAGFDATPFIGSWTAQGTCIGQGTTCESNISASWSASIVARVPEPGILALLGLGLAGLGFARRRKLH